MNTRHRAFLRASTLYAWRTPKEAFSVSSCNCQEKSYDVTLRKKRDFVDKVRILVRGGSGGMGYPSTGGMGGNGGQLVFESKKGASLAQFGSHLSKRITGAHGTNCKKTKISGNHGEPKKFYVPPGTIVSCTEDGILADFDQPRQKVVVAKGGSGGRHFNKFNGQPGQKRVLVLELKSIADIGLIGYPNAGKSTFLSNISKAKPKIGHYAFTTIRPTVGSIFYPDRKQVTIADLPGLIEDAHINKGMGHRFLRHVERTKGLLILIDVNGFQLKEGTPLRSPLETLCHLLRELYLYKNALLQMPALIALNKVDNERCLPLYESARDSILEVDEESVQKILRDPEVVSTVYEKINGIRGNEGKDIIRTSTKFGIGLTEIRDHLYDITFTNNDEDVSEDDEDFDDKSNDEVDKFVAEVS